MSQLDLLLTKEHSSTSVFNSFEVNPKCWSAFLNSKKVECILCNQLLQQCILVSSQENHDLLSSSHIFLFFLVPKGNSLFNWNHEYWADKTNLSASRYDKSTNRDRSIKKGRSTQIIHRKETKMMSSSVPKQQISEQEPIGRQEIKRNFGGRNKRNHWEKHRTNKLVISNLVSTRCAHK